MKRTYHPAFILALVTLAVWAVTLTFGFVWDDFPMISANSSLHQWTTLILGWSSDFWMLHDAPQVSGYWRPIPTMVHVILTQFTPASAWVFHLLNVILHFLTAYFFYKFLIQTQLVKWFWISIIFFLWHPINAEAVSFNSAVPDLLCAMFGWAALMTWTGDSRAFGEKIFVTLLLLMLSFLSKESGVFFGVFLIGMEWLLKKDSFRQSAKPFLGIVAMMLTYVVLHLAVTKSIGARDIWGGSVAIHAATVCKLFVYQVLLLFIPFGSSPTRDFDLGSWSELSSWIGASLLILFVVGIFYYRKSKPVYAFAIFFYLIFWFPISNIIPAEGLIADRYLYLPSMAIAFAIGLVLNRLVKFPKLFGVGLIFWGVWAMDHALVWKNSKTLWGHAVEASPLSSVAWNEWGNIHSSKRNYQQAYESYDRALQLRPKNRDASFNRALVMYLVSDADTINAIDQHLEKFPNDPQALDLFGSLYESKKDLLNAEIFSKKAVLAQPENWKYRYNLASVYLQLKKYDEAIIELEKAHQIAPQRFEVIKNLAAGYCLNAKYSDCIRMYDELIQKFPEKKEETQFQMQQAKQLLELTQGT
jgi:tetratricopeptide (TPR) repeat protein